MTSFRYACTARIDGTPVPWYAWTMFKMIENFQCECEVCGHVWVSSYLPPRCSGCKSRKWNAKGMEEAKAVKAPERESLPAPMKEGGSAKYAPGVVSEPTHETELVPFDEI